MSRPISLVSDEIVSKMRLLKLHELEKGELTDVSFLVGPEGGNEVVHCFKNDLLLASEYFRGLFRSPLTGPSPIRMKHVQPHIFKILIQDISTKKFDKNLTIEDAVDVAHVADEFLLDDLKSYYLEVVKEKVINVENVWNILNRSKIPSFKALCDEVLSTKTSACLEHESFLEASQESFMYLLQLDEMNIESEAELIDACLKLANTKPEEERGEVVKAALPYLRLLTLKLHEIQRKLLEYLSESERSNLLLMLSLSPEEQTSDLAETVGNLCQTKLARQFIPPKPLARNYIFDIIPESKFIPDWAALLKTKLFKCKLCELEITPDCNMLLTALDILIPIKMEQTFCAKGNLDGFIRTHLDGYPFFVNVTVMDLQNSRVLHAQNFDIDGSFESWCQVKFDKEVVISKGVRTYIMLSYDKKHTFFGFPNDFISVSHERIGRAIKLSYANQTTYKHTLNCFMIKSVHFIEP